MSEIQSGGRLPRSVLLLQQNGNQVPSQPPLLLGVAVRGVHPNGT